ncbi:MAG TPA: VIT family protein [Acidimicrobiia bacterium]|jgi:VIT1/CCC1 family predicted Fe2+/Mn2+ transporter
MLLHRERHRFRRIGWLRAAVLGANDGIVSTTSLMIGVAAANGSNSEVAVAGVAGLVAGAMSMAAGEYVSVSSQRDTELADIRREQRELSTSPELELAELTQIYVRRGIAPDLARRVAEQLTASDPLDAHLRDELGMTGAVPARPWQAAGVSAVSFALGAIVPLLTMVFVSGDARIPVLAAVALVVLAATGALGGRLGGAPMPRAAGRVLAGGTIAMGLTALIGDLIGSNV